MKISRAGGIGASLLALLFCACNGPEAPAADSPIPATEPASDPGAEIGFDDVALGGLPVGWRIESTGEAMPPAEWKVVPSDTTSSAGRALALTTTNHDAGGAFNLCWTNEVPFESGTIEVSVRADSGDGDQGGGPIWRAKDKDNYYICRANPLEANFRLYVVKGGKRTQLASALLEIATGAWHAIRVEHDGPRIACWIDGQKLLEAVDEALPGPGGVGFWTKADALTSFDDLRVSPRIGPQGDLGR